MLELFHLWCSRYFRCISASVFLYGIHDQYGTVYTSTLEYFVRQHTKENRQATANKNEKNPFAFLPFRPIYSVDCRF